MKNIFFLVLISIAWSSCSRGPEPIRFGHDSCDHCKMVIMDPKFGAEIVTKKGKVFKFDDVNCFIAYQEEHQLAGESIAHQLVIDFDKPETLINIQVAAFVYSDQIRSPMASNLAAFSDMSAMEKYYQEWGGEVLTWEEVKLLFE
jgi:copper chaperone NosL